MKLASIISTVVLTFVALVARAETDPVALKAQIKQVQAETRDLRQQTKTLKEANQGPILAAKLAKAQAAREKAQVALIKAQAVGVTK